MKTRLAQAFAAAFGVTLAVVIGNRLPQATLPIIAGFMFAAGLFIPTTLLIAGIYTDNLRFQIPIQPYVDVTYVEATPVTHYTTEPHPTALLAPPQGT